MASSYSLFDMDSIPPGDSNGVLMAPFQREMFKDEFEQPPQTKFNLERISDSLSMKVFRCTHDSIVNTQGRVRDYRFARYIGIRVFPAYFFQAERLLLVKTPKVIAKSAIKEMNKIPGFDAELRQIEVESLRPLINNDLKGAYFDVDTSPDVSTLALFGPSIGLDFRFEEALKDGQIKQARFLFEYESIYYHIGISRDRGIWLLDSNLDEEGELKLILNIKDSLIDKANPIV